MSDKGEGGSKIADVFRRRKCMTPLGSTVGPSSVGIFICVLEPISLVGILQRLNPIYAFIMFLMHAFIRNMSIRNRLKIDKHYRQAEFQ